MIAYCDMTYSKREKHEESLRLGTYWEDFPEEAEELGDAGIKYLTEILPLDVISVSWCYDSNTGCGVQLAYDIDSDTEFDFEGTEYFSCPSCGTRFSEKDESLIKIYELGVYDACCPYCMGEWEVDDDPDNCFLFRVREEEGEGENE